MLNIAARQITRTVWNLLGTFSPPDIDLDGPKPPKPNEPILR